MVLTSSGYVFTWGSGVQRLGHGNIKLEECSSIPCLDEGLREHNAFQISSGYYHCTVLVDPSPSIIRQSQEANFKKKQHSDVVFMIENEHVYANIEVLSQKSDYFAGMFWSNVRESINRVVKVPKHSYIYWKICVLVTLLSA